MSLATSASSRAWAAHDEPSPMLASARSLQHTWLWPEATICQRPVTIGNPPSCAGPTQPQQISHALSHPSHGTVLVEAGGTVWAWQPDTGNCRQLPAARLPGQCTRAVLVPEDAPEAAGGTPVGGM